VPGFETCRLKNNGIKYDAIFVDEGQDYSRVFLVGLDWLDSLKCSEEQTLNLTYVGVTRARHQIVIPYVQQNDLINRLAACL
jgi:superfamily I DNA/RNA helicase